MTRRLRVTVGAATIAVLTMGHSVPAARQGPSPSFLVNSADYALAADGSALGAAGATVTLRSVAANPVGFGSAMSQLSAEPYRQRRITVAGELQTRGASRGASLWLRLNAGDDLLILDNGAGDAVFDDADWTSRAMTFPVPAETTTIQFGAILQSTGTVIVRHLRLSVGDPIDPGAPLSTAARAELDAALAFVRKASMRRDAIDWPTLEPAVRALAAGSSTSVETYPAIRYLLTRLGDHHSQFHPPSVEVTRNAPAGANDPVPEVRAIGGRVGYIAMPGFVSAAAEATRAYAQRMLIEIARAADEASCGWMLDLRNDTGGNMWPMLAGLRPFLGSGVVGSFEGAAGSGSSWRATVVDVGAIPSALAGLESSPVAVLTGPRTMSSGEAVAIAFRGRAKTRTFGQPTGGYSTANAGQPLPDGAAIFVTTAVDGDRTGRRYGGAVDPDERVGPPSGPPSATDQVADAARSWIVKSCRPAAIR